MFCPSFDALNDSTLNVTSLESNATSLRHDVTTISGQSNVTQSASLLQYARMRYAINDIVLPVIFGLGLAGNVLNAIVLTRRRDHVTSGVEGGGAGVRRTAFERSAAVGLLALTLSDLAFCLVGFSRVFFVNTGGGAGWRTVAGIYYGVYRGALHNLFLFTSTWMIALVSVERYLAVCHPFRAAALIHVRRTVVAHVSVVVVSVLVNIPLFLRNTIVRCPCRVQSPVDSSSSWAVCYYAQPSVTLYTSKPGLLYAHKIVWFGLGTFIPLLLIVYSNIRLVREICVMHRASSASAASKTVSKTVAAAAPSAAAAFNKERSVTLTLTLTLIAIAVCFLLLVCPSMLIQFSRSSGRVWINLADPPSTPTAGSQMEQTAILVTNMTQAVKFASNFLLYCVVSRSFRRTFSKLLVYPQCLTRRRLSNATIDSRQLHVALVPHHNTC